MENWDGLFGQSWSEWRGAFEQVNLLYGENPDKAVCAFTAPFKEAGIKYAWRIWRVSVIRVC